MSAGNYLEFAVFVVLFCLQRIQPSDTVKSRHSSANENRTIPDQFLIGVATSAYQIEGGWSTDGKGESIWDNLVHTRPELIRNQDDGDIACDSYHLYKSDIALIKSLGFQVYRFSISWSRILPKGDTNYLNFAGIDYYRVLIDECLANGIQPMITLYHWDLPRRMQDFGGWLNPMISDYMEDYASLVFELYGEKVKLWVTINEPFQIVGGYADLTNVSKAPALYLDSPANYIVAHNLLRSHARVYRLYERKFRATQKGKVGITIDTNYYIGKTTTAKDTEATARAWAFNFQIFADPIFSENGDFPEIVKKRVAANSQKEGRRRSRLPEFTENEIESLKGSSDFFGLNHYSTFLCTDEPEPYSSLASKDRAVKFEEDPKWPTNDAGWPVVPEGIREVLRFIKMKYNNPPVFITENGYGSKPGILNDENRIKYHRDYLSEILTAKGNYGCNVIGYIVWSILDNFEWNYGYEDCIASKQRFAESLEQEIQEETGAGNDVIFFGDVNINLLDERDSAEYQNMFMSQGCLSIQNHPTRDQNCLDHVFTNCETNIVACKVPPVCITDHAVLEIWVGLRSCAVLGSGSRRVLVSVLTP